MTWAEPDCPVCYEVESSTAVIFFAKWKSDSHTAKGYMSQLTPLDSMTEITAVDKIVCEKTLWCFSFLSTYLLWYWTLECETKLNDGKPRSREEGEWRGQKEGESVWTNMSNCSGWAETLTASICSFCLSWSLFLSFSFPFKIWSHSCTSPDWILNEVYIH